MWSNTLNSDVIKDFVALGTEIVKIIDKVGLLNTVLITLATVSMVKQKMGPITFFKELLTVIPNGVKALQTWIQRMQASDAATLASAKVKLADTAATTANTAANVENAASSAASGAAEDKDTVDTGENIAATVVDTEKTKENTAANLENAASNVASGAGEAAGGAVAGGAVAGGTAAGGATAFTGLAAAVPHILIAVAAIAAAVVIFKLVTKDIGELKDELQDAQAEFDGTKSEIDSINNELETTQKRIAELLAKPSLSFVEQEELERLQRQNELLERNLKLQQMILAQQEAEVVKKTQTYLDATWSGAKWDKAYAVNGATGIISEDKWYTRGVSGTEALDIAIEKYAETKKTSDSLTALALNWDDNSADGNAALIKSLGLENYIYAGVDTKEYVLEQKQAFDTVLTKIAGGIGMVLNDPQYTNLSYGMSEEIDAFLDEYNAYVYKFQEAQGLGGKSSAISSIFNDASSDSIKKLKENLTDIAADDSLDAAQKQTKAAELVSKAINNTTGDYDRLKTSMDIVGITADEVARYFVQLSSAPDSSSIEGITAQYQKGVSALEAYKGAATDVIATYTNLDGAVEQISWGSLFDTDGNAIDSQIAKIMQGADETARKEFARIAEAVNEGKLSVDAAMQSFSLSGVQAGYKLLENAVVDINNDVFKDLGDEISGLIDTFDEFGAALESVANAMDLVNQAQAEMAYSGKVSVETALDLINSTDNWNEVLTVENGNIQLVDGAMDILAQSKLNQIKTNLQLALSEAQAGLEQARLAESGGEVAKTLEESTTESVRQLAANMEYLSTLVGEFLAGNFLGAGSAAKAAKENSLKATEYQKTTTASSMSVADWEEKVSNIESKLAILEGVDTPEEFSENYYSDKVSGGNKTAEDVADDAFQREMDYWENRIAANQAKYEQLQNEIDLLEAKGQRADASFYEEQIKLENERKRLLEQQKAAAQAHLATLDEGSEEWWEAANILNDIEGELDDVTASIVDLQDAIGEIDTYKFDEFNTRLDNLASKLGTIRDLIAPDGEEDWFNEEGNWTDAGVAVVGTYLQELEMYKQGYESTMDELAKYESPYVGNEEYYASLGIHSEQEYYDKTEELISQQYDFAESISDTEQSIVDMYESSIDATEEYIETLIDGYNDYIDSVKEALEAERDLYDFKKNVQKQTKDIAELERRIASLSGSTNKADIAERRKLEAQLYESRESLNDTYYDHAKDAQNEALDAEAKAYEETMTKMVEGMRTSFEQATSDMTTFLDNVTTIVSLNAGAILTEYQNTGLELDPALTTPWVNAKNAVSDYSGDALDLMNTWAQNGFLTTFSETVEGSLTSPWSAGSTAADSFKTSVDTVMTDVVDAIATNVRSASTELSDLYQQILDTEQKAASANITPGGNSNNLNVGGNKTTTQTATAYLQTTRGLLSATGTGSSLSAAQEAAKTAVLQKAYNAFKSDHNDSQLEAFYDGWYKNVVFVKPQTTKSSGGAGGTGKFAVNLRYAKGTTGTSRDQWAITDEPWLGDELVLVPGKDGNLSYMRKGTGVVPADLTANLMEWGQFTPDSLNLGGGVNVNMINNAVNKPEFNFAFDALVKAENITEETLPAVKKLVTQEINRFTKELNYALKGKGAR